MKKIFILLSITTLFNLSFGQSNIPVGNTCPNFKLTDSEGTSHSLYDLCDAGQYVVLDFFTFWCGPCMKTAPAIQEFYTKYGCNQGDVFVLGIECDPSATTAMRNSFKSSAGLPTNSFPIVMGNKQGADVKSQFGVAAHPTVIIIGPDRKMMNNDVYPISGVASIESAFPSGSINVKSCGVASSEQNAIQANLHVYPNPVADVLNVKIEYIQNVSIYDASGKTIFTSAYNNIDQLELDVRDFDNGLYIISVATANGVITSRFMKK